MVINHNTHHELASGDVDTLYASSTYRALRLFKDEVPISVAETTRRITDFFTCPIKPSLHRRSEHAQIMKNYVMEGVYSPDEVIKSWTDTKNCWVNRHFVTSDFGIIYPNGNLVVLPTTSNKGEILPGSKRAINYFFENKCNTPKNDVPYESERRNFQLPEDCGIAINFSKEELESLTNKILTKTEAKTSRLLQVLLRNDPSMSSELTFPELSSKVIEVVYPHPCNEEKDANVGIFLKLPTLDPKMFLFRVGSLCHEGVSAIVIHNYDPTEVFEREFFVPYKVSKEEMQSGFINQTGIFGPAQTQNLERSVA